MPHAMFHATPRAASRAIDMLLAEVLRHPARDGVDQLDLYGELRERVVGIREIRMLDPAAQRREPFEQLFGVIVARAMDAREDRQDPDAALDEPGPLRAVDRQRWRLALPAGPRGELAATAKPRHDLLQPALRGL